METARKQLKGEKDERMSDCSVVDCIFTHHGHL